MVSNKARQLAEKAHKGQTYKDKDYFIYHVMGVTGLVSEATGDSEEHRTVAILHDVVEDSDISIEEIRYKFGDRIGDSVDAITRRKGETYDDYIERCAEDDIASIVKTCDATFNMLESLEDGDYKRVNKYANVVKRMTRRM